jgi:hypothetical protein
MERFIVAPAAGAFLLAAYAMANPAAAQNTCEVTGRVTSSVGFIGKDDRGEKSAIDDVHLMQGASHLASVKLDARVIKVRDHRVEARLREYEAREYHFSAVQPGADYSLTLGRYWRTKPAEIQFSCPNRQGQNSFTVGPLEHVGNWLGG